jgi:hypothetical protein
MDFTQYWMGNRSAAFCLDSMGKSASKSPYRKCRGWETLGSTRMLGAGALVDRALRYFTSLQRCQRYN